MRTPRKTPSKAASSEKRSTELYRRSGSIRKAVKMMVSRLPRRSFANFDGVVARARLTESGLRDLEVLFVAKPKSSGGRHFGSRLVFDDRVQDALQRLGVPSRDEIVSLSRRVERLTKAVDSAAGPAT